MRKNEVALKRRREYIKNELNTRHKSETANMCVIRLSKELFLSEQTIWKDYAKS